MSFLDSGINNIFSVVALISIGLAFLLFLAYLIYLFVYKRIQMNHEMRLAAIKAGVPLPTERERYGSLKAGIVTTAVGAGLLIGLLMNAESEGVMIGAEIMIALLPLFVGIGLIIFHALKGKNTPSNN